MGKIFAIMGLVIFGLYIVGCAAVNLSDDEYQDKISYCFNPDCCNCAMYEGSTPPLTSYDIFDIGCSCCACVNSTAHDMLIEKYGRVGYIHGFESHCIKYEQETGINPHCFYGGR